MVCDPTLLMSEKDYLEISKDVKEKYKYIFLYLFEDLSKTQGDKLKEFAKNNNLKIISGKSNNYYCSDKHIINAPQTFLNYMSNAEYVITDTFHGVIFSTNLEKNIWLLIEKKSK